MKARRLACALAAVLVAALPQGSLASPAATGSAADGGARATPFPAVAGSTARPLDPLAARAAAVAAPGSAALASTASVAGQAASPLAVADGSGLTPMSPVRVLDTRNGTGRGGVIGPVGPNVTITLDLSARVPASATAVFLNVTGTEATASTYVTVFPFGSERPTASNLNLVAGQTRPNAVTVATGAGTKINLYNHTGSTHLVADLAGYYAPDAGSKYTAQAPVRVLDTRNGPGPVGPNATITVDLSGRVPASATAVTFNLTGVSPTANTYVTAWPDGTARPTASNLNLTPGTVAPNLVTVALGANRKIALYNHVGSIHLVADLAGFYATDMGVPFYRLSPLRVLDTRPAGGLGPDTTGVLGLSGWLPATATAVVFNLTGTNTTASTYVTAWPDGSSRPTASNLNLVAGQTAPNLVTVALGPQEGAIDIYNHVGYVDLIVDLAGYFAPPPDPCLLSCARAWGDNTWGQLGNGTTGGWSNTPEPVAGISGITAATAGLFNTYALSSDGGVWAWGLNDFQGLGNGLDYGSSPVPVRVQLRPGTTAVATSTATGYALNGGQVFGWGYNGDGEIGNGTTEIQTSPQQTLLPFTDATAVAAGYSTGYALRSDGTVWAWGANGGSLGNGSYGTGCDLVPVGPGCRELTPVQVSGLTNVISIAADWDNAFAVKSDGTVWAWGWNAEGELGIGTVGGPACYNNPTGPNCVAVAPVQVPGLTGVTKVVGGISTAYALKSDGTVWAWGWNRQGQLGIGTTGGDGCATNPQGPNCASAVPVQVSTLTGVTDVAAGRLFAMALKSDSTVWTWGDNRFGQLATAAPSDVPVQVPALSGATKIGAGGFVGLAVQP
jgi:alpha-tubulin suppressor-like RCC1 family protein